jgi:WD40 repeat protein
MRVLLAGIGLTLAFVLAACDSQSPASPTQGAATATMPPGTAVPDPTLTARPPATDLPGFPTLIPTLNPTPIVIPGAEVFYGQGVVPTGGALRIGMGSTPVIVRSLDRRLLAVGTTVGVYVFDAQTMAQLWQVFVRSPVTHLEWSPDGSSIAVSLYEWPNILVWDADTGELLHRLENSLNVADLDWSPDGTTLAAGLDAYFSKELADYVTSIVLWDTASWQQTFVFQPEIEELVHGKHSAEDIEWSPDGSTLAAVVGYLEAALIDPASGEVKHVLRQEPRGHDEVQHVAYSPDGTKLLTYTGISGPGDAPGGSNQVYVWDAASGALLFTLDHAVGDFFIVVTHAEWSDGGTTITSYAGSTWDPMIQDNAVWDAATGARLESLPVGIVVPAPDNPPPDGVYVLPSGAVLVWPPDLAPYPVILDLSYSVADLRWSPDGSQVATLPLEGSESPIAVWTLRSGQPAQFLSTTETIQGWALSTPSGASCQNENYDPPCWFDLTGRFRATYTIEFADDYDSSSAKSTLTITDANTNAVLYEIEENASMEALAFSADGSILAVSHQPASRGIWQPGVTSTDDCFVTLYDMASGEAIVTYYGHTGTVYSMLWSPDGKMLATLSADGTIVFWPVPQP